MNWKEDVQRLLDGEKIYDKDFDVEVSSTLTNIYLAGPVNDYPASARVREEARELARSLPAVNLVDPLECEPDTPGEIPPHDLQLVAECDAIVTYYVAGTETWGTSGELYVAAALGIPVVVWEIETPKQNNYSPWFESIVDVKKKQFRQALHKAVKLV